MMHHLSCGRRSLASASISALLSISSLVADSRPAGAADPIEIPIILPMTGGAAFLGKGDAETAAIIEADKKGEIRGRPIRFVLKDDQTNPETAVQLMNGVLQKQSPVVIDGAPLATCRARAALVHGQITEFCVSPSLKPEVGSSISR